MIVVANLTGHNGSIRSLSWNPHDGSKLVTVGEDSLAQVLLCKNFVSFYKSFFF